MCNQTVIVYVFIHFSLNQLTADENKREWQVYNKCNMIISAVRREWIKAISIVFTSRWTLTNESICFSSSMYGDVNISAILDSFSGSYDKRVRPNYGGESTFPYSYIIYVFWYFIVLTNNIDFSPSPRTSPRLSCKA